MQGIVSRSEKRARPSKAETTHLGKAAHKWDLTVRRMLQRFARQQWPDEHILGLIPVRRYRLRKQFEPGNYMWWVERDIPPFDRYRCEAYRVELSLAGPDQPRLVVRTGISAYSVAPISIEGLNSALVRAGVDTPLVIRRQFGPALDP